jgi:hypothetical protein
MNSEKLRMKKADMSHHNRNDGSGGMKMTHRLSPREIADAETRASETRASDVMKGAARFE